MSTDSLTASPMATTEMPSPPVPRHDERGRALVRRPTDAVTLVVATAAFLLLAQRAYTVSALGENVYWLVHDLPSILHGLFAAVYQLGSVWVIGVVVAVALWRRRFALAGTMVGAAAGAWAAGGVAASLIDSNGHLVLPPDLAASGVTPSFPLLRMAVVAAVVSVLAAHLGRTARLLGGLAVAGVGAAALFLGTALPGDVLGGAALGWAVAALALLLVGAPARRPTAAQVAVTLADLGLEAIDVREVASPVAGTAEMAITTADGRRLAARVTGEDQHDAGVLVQSWHWLTETDYQPTFFHSRLQQVEHEAYVTLRAAQAGAPVPEVVAAAAVGRDAALLVEARPDGPRLSELSPAQVTDEVLDEVWSALAALRRAGLAHGRPSAERVIVTSEGGAVLTDLSAAVAIASTDQKDRDVAELLAASGAIVGAERAVAAARRAVGTEAVHAALPLLQPRALSRSTMRSIPVRSRLLRRLRQVGADDTDQKPPKRQQLRRVTAKDLLTGGMTLLGVNALLAQIGSFSDVGAALAHARWGWVLLGLGVSLLTYPLAAAGVMASLSVRLPFGRVVELQLANKFMNLVAPGQVGSTAMEVRFLQSNGVSAAAALTSSATLDALGALSSVGLVALCAWIGGSALNTGGLPDGLGRFGILLVLALGIGAVLVHHVPKLRDKVVPQLQQARATVKELATSPRRLAVVILSSAGVSLLFALCLAACLQAYGASVPLATLVVVNWSASTVANLTPVPGGMGVVEAGLVAGLTAAGVPLDVAVAAALTHRLVTFWLPPIFGWAAMRDLTEQEYI